MSEQGLHESTSSSQLEASRFIATAPDLLFGQASDENPHLSYDKHPQSIDSGKVGLKSAEGLTMLAAAGNTRSIDISRRGLLGAAIGAGAATIIGRNSSLADGGGDIEPLPTEESVKLTPESLKGVLPYELGWLGQEDGFGRVHFGLEDRLVHGEIPVHGVTLNRDFVDPKGEYTDPAKMFRDGFDYILYRNWLTSNNLTESDRSFLSWRAARNRKPDDERYEDLSFDVFGKEGKASESKHITIDPRNRMVQVYLTSPGITTFQVSDRHGYGFRVVETNEGEQITVLEAWAPMWPVQENGYKSTLTDQSDPKEIWKYFFATPPAYVGAIMAEFTEVAQNNAFSQEKAREAGEEALLVFGRYFVDTEPVDLKTRDGLIRGVIYAST